MWINHIWHEMFQGGVYILVGPDSMIVDGAGLGYPGLDILLLVQLNHKPTGRPTWSGRDKVPHRLK